MYCKSVLLSVFVASLMLGGCASVPMAPVEEDLALKEFTPPPEDKSGLYVYRNCFIGAALKKNVYLDNKLLGETAEDVYFYKLTNHGNHTVSTESEFSDNSLDINMNSGSNYYVEQYIKMGVFVGGANLRQVSEKEAMKAIGECKLAKSVE